MLTLAPEHYPLLEKSVAWLQDHYHEQPELAEIAEAAGFSPMHFQRIFKAGVGVSPKRFLQATTLKHARKLLKENSVLDTSLALGLSSPGRLHDLCVEGEAVAPGEMRSRGKGLEIFWGVHSTPFGPALFALSQRGLCELDFLPDQRCPELTPEEALRQKWPGARLIESPERTAFLPEQIFSTRPGPLTLYLQGTNFQLQVWQALLRIPEGQMTTYGAIARWLGKEQASRAVGSAVGQNPLSYLIPCHRVLRGDGGIGGYAGGLTRKRILLASETCACLD